MPNNMERSSLYIWILVDCPYCSETNRTKEGEYSHAISCQYCGSAFIAEVEKPKTEQTEIEPVTFLPDCIFKKIEGKVAVCKNFGIDNVGGLCKKDCKHSILYKNKSTKGGS